MIRHSLSETFNYPYWLVGLFCYKLNNKNESNHTEVLSEKLRGSAKYYEIVKPTVSSRLLIIKRGSVKCRLWTDGRLLFLGLENNGPIVVTYSFA